MAGRLKSLTRQPSLSFLKLSAQSYVTSAAGWFKNITSALINTGSGDLVNLKILEKDVLKDCRQLLDHCQARDQLFYTRISSGAVLRAGAFSKNRDMVGIEDLQVYLHDGQTLHIEVKSSEGTLSAEQRVRRRKLWHFDHLYEVIRSADVLGRLLEKYGVKIGL